MVRKYPVFLYCMTKYGQLDCNLALWINITYFRLICSSEGSNISAGAITINSRIKNTPVDLCGHL